MKWEVLFIDSTAYKKKHFCRKQIFSNSCFQVIQSIKTKQILRHSFHDKMNVIILKKKNNC